MPTTTFTFTGSEQTWVVPNGVFDIDATLYGAGGGPQENSFSSEVSGGRAIGTIPVTPGETLRFYVGEAGEEGPTFDQDAPSTPGGWNGGGDGGGGGGDHDVHAGGGGGGASDIRQGGSTLNDRVIVAGGGGGSSNNEDGGAGGGLEGGDSYNPEYGDPTTGGTQTEGGTGWGNDGEFGIGGSGDRAGTAGSTDSRGGGGGGGGWYGGAGGIGHSYGDTGGGGGSGYVDNSLSNTSLNRGAGNTGNGQIVIEYNLPTPTLELHTQAEVPQNNLSWEIDTEEPNADYEYRVYRSTSSGVAVDQSNRIATVTDTADGSYIDQSVSRGQTYYYVVTLYDPIQGDETVASNEENILTAAVVRAYTDGSFISFPMKVWDTDNTEWLWAPSVKVYDEETDSWEIISNR